MSLFNLNVLFLPLFRPIFDCLIWGFALIYSNRCLWRVHLMRNFRMLINILDHNIAVSLNFM